MFLAFFLFFFKLHVSSSSFFELSSCVCGSLWCFCSQLLQWPPTKRQRQSEGEGEGGGPGKEGTCMGLLSSCEQVKGTGRWHCLFAVCLCLTSLKRLVNPLKLYKMFRKTFWTWHFSFLRHLSKEEDRLSNIISFQSLSSPFSVRSSVKLFKGWGRGEGYEDYQANYSRLSCLTMKTNGYH